MCEEPVCVCVKKLCTGVHTGVPHLQENASSQDPTGGLRLGPCGCPMRGAVSNERGTPVEEARRREARSDGPRCTSQNRLCCQYIHSRHTLHPCGPLCAENRASIDSLPPRPSILSPRGGGLSDLGPIFSQFKKRMKKGELNVLKFKSRNLSKRFVLLKTASDERGTPVHVTPCPPLPAAPNLSPPPPHRHHESPSPLAVGPLLGRCVYPSPHESDPPNGIPAPGSSPPSRVDLVEG